MVVDDVGQMVGGEFVSALVEHLVVEDVAHDAHIATDDVVDVDFLAGLHLEAHDVLLTGLDETLGFFLAEHEGVAHGETGVGVILEVLHFFTLAVEFLGGVEGDVGLTGIEELAHVLLVDIATLALTVGTVVATEAYALVELNAEPLEGFDDIVLSAGHEAIGVGILNAEHHVAAVLAGKEIVVEGGAHTTDMKRARRARRKAHANFSFGCHSHLYVCLILIVFFYSTTKVLLFYEIRPTPPIVFAFLGDDRGFSTDFLLSLSDSVCFGLFRLAGRHFPTLRPSFGHQQ